MERNDQFKKQIGLQSLILNIVPLDWNCNHFQSSKLEGQWSQIEANNKITASCGKIHFFMLELLGYSKHYQLVETRHFIDLNEMCISTEASEYCALEEGNYALALVKVKRKK